MSGEPSGEAMGQKEQRLRWAGALTGHGLLLLSAVLPWLRRGPGSSLRGHELADALLSLHRSLPGVRAWWLAALWYAVPMCGAAGIVAVALRGPVTRSGLVLGVVALLAAAVFAAVAARVSGVGALGSGVYAALAGGAFAVVATVRR